MFGLPVPQDIIEKQGPPTRYWGARAIFHPGAIHPFDLLADRQQVKCAEGLDAKPLCDWVNKVGFKKLQAAHGFANLTSDCSDMVEVKDGQFTIRCTPNASYGYLYIGAWQYWPKGCEYEQKELTQGAKWSGYYQIPKIGDTIEAAINGRWRGVVTAYFVEHGYQGVEVDCSKGETPKFFKKQGGDPKRVLLFGSDFSGDFPINSDALFQACVQRGVDAAAVAAWPNFKREQFIAANPVVK